MAMVMPDMRVGDMDIHEESPTTVKLRGSRGTLYLSYQELRDLSLLLETVYRWASLVTPR